MAIYDGRDAQIGGRRDGPEEIGTLISQGTGPGGKSDEYYFLLLESEGPREDAEVMADGAKALAWLNGFMMADDPKFRAPTIHGITKKNADGLLSNYAQAECHIEMRVAVFPDTTVLGPDGKVVENERPTTGEITLKLAANNEPLRRALLIYGSLKHTWIYLYNVLEAIEDGNGGERGLIAKNLVAHGKIRDFKATANSFRALGLAARHGTTASGIPTPRMTLQEAEEMFRNLIEGWVKDLK